MNLAFVCIGAGRGVRFGGDKLAAMLGSRTVFAAALGALAGAVPEALLVVVVDENRLEFWREILAPEYPQARFVCGGNRRQDSVRAGVLYAAQAGAEVAAVHDAARPLVHPGDIQAVIGMLGSAAGSILTTRVVDTVKRVDSHDVVVDTVPRERFRLAQTPQVFRVATLIELWQRADPSRTWSDEAALLESAGMPVNTVLARHPNPKIINEADLRLVRAMMEAGP